MVPCSSYLKAGALIFLKAFLFFVLAGLVHATHFQTAVLNCCKCFGSENVLFVLLCLPRQEMSTLFAFML